MLFTLHESTFIRYVTEVFSKESLLYLMGM